MKTNSVAFDNTKYLEEQSKAILERIERFDNKLYLEFGGKLLFDHHASRVLPGFDPNVKIRLLSKLRDQAEIIICIYAGDIERKKMRADFGITWYDPLLLLGVFGTFVGLTIRNIGNTNLLPTRDPKLKESLNFVNL